jgi:putative ABC transport system permease protein
MIPKDQTMISVLEDVRFGLRVLRRNPALALTAVFTLALGIGANTSIFSLVNTVMFRPLRFQESGRLMILSEQNTKNHHWQRNPALATSLDWKKHARSFAEIEFAVTYTETANLVAERETKRITVQWVSPGLPGMLGVKPVLGRGFNERDVTQANPQDALQGNVLISHALWQRLWGGDPKVLGKRLDTSVGTYTIIGVMPPDTWVYPWVRNASIWISQDPTGPAQRPDTRWFGCIARLKPGATVEQAQAEVSVLGQRLVQAHPETNRDWTATALPLREAWYGDDKYLLYMLMGAVGFVLLIACANVANLLLARSGARTTEMAVRASIGGTRARIVRQLLTESVVLALIGGALGLTLSYWGVALLMSLVPDWFGAIGDVVIDYTVLGFTLGVSMLTGVLFGVAPAIHISGLDLNRSLKEGGDRSGGRSRQLGGNLLVVGEVTLTMVLLAGAGLMINSFIRVSRVDIGFDPSHLLTASVELDGNTYRQLLPDDMQRVTPAVDNFFQQAVERVAKVPGVVSATLEGQTRDCPIRITGRPEDGSEPPSAVFTEAGTGYFATMRIPLLAGRALSTSDDERSPWVAVINATMAKRYFSRETPVGKQLFVSFTDTGGRKAAEGRPREIVGVVGDVREFGAGQAAPAMMYVPDRQHIRDYPGGAGSTHLSKMLVVRTMGNPLAFSDTLRKVVAGIDRTQVVADARSMDQIAADGVAPWRVLTQIFGFLSGLAIVLAAGGIYGVMSYTVSRRTHEIGVRVALGAGSRDVISLVLKQGLKVTVPGILLGLGGALAVTRGIGELLYGVSPNDPLTFSIVSLLLTVIALAACYFPARRAMNVDPVRALRNE